MSEKVALVTGVGSGNGAALTRRLTKVGYRVAMLARSADRLSEFESSIPGSRAYPTDVSDLDALRTTCENVTRELGPIRTIVHNAGSGAFSAFLDTRPEDLENAFRVNTLALMTLGQVLAPSMIAQGSGEIIVIGATASLRGGAAFAGFAPAKAAQRSLAQSMARGLGPLGIHVAYLIIDGVIDIPKTRGFFKDKPDEFFLKPDAIAESVMSLIEQDRSAWTFELDVRPFQETW